ncbi:MAG: DsbC family protein [Gammaproteobacteria bacterium]
MHKTLLLMMLSLALTLSAPIHADDLGELRKALAMIAPDTQPDAITLSAIPGLYEIVYGTDVFYMTKDGRYMLQGDVIDMVQRRNATEAKRAEVRLKELGAIKEESMIVFAPKETKHTLTVFTDIDCGYCRKLHSEIAELNSHGIKVRYLAFPRAGLDSPSYDKAVTVWCSKDRNQAMTSAKSDEVLEKKTCDNPVKQHMALAKKLNVTGTPTLMLEDGQFIPGFVPVDKLIKLLDENKNKA